MTLIGKARTHSDAVHDLNMTVNHDLQLADAVAWSAAFIDRSLLDGRKRSHASTVSVKDNAALPANCGSAKTYDGPSSPYARTSVTVP
jgi:hypothetical protein